MKWPIEDLKKIAAADDLHISPFRDDGQTYGTPTWIWSVVVDDAVYVRAYSGRNSRWYKAALRQEAGRIITAGLTWDVRFESADDAFAERIDEAYRAKYGKSAYLGSMISARSREATVRITPAGNPAPPGV